ncbi:TMEM175 family protein [Streptomyces sp. NBC_01433]|uniref:TMEM175 family protein n=1 Tax=Streptomyces sp. NBC_01433 TaxID=2903864 RepID=UPI002258773E|nr:TMEM175 family protein [Streptomyces sp. NBC_01433]MCX4681904.1 TMEM175 family protein [Streptomyces sp. NBC_01433]
MTVHAGPGRADKADEKSLDRLTALSDGIFAISMTLLVLDIHVTAGLDPADFRHMAHDLLPKIGAYALSFAILAGIWRDHRRILQLTRRAEGLCMRLTLAGLGVIALVPFPTTMLSEYASQPLAVAVYATTMVIINLLQLAALIASGYRPHRRVTTSGHGGFNVVTDLSTTALVFAATVPIAYVSTTAAIWTWLALIPIRMALARRGRRQSRRNTADSPRP